MLSVSSQSPEPSRGSVPFARRVVDRYSPEDPHEAQAGSSETPQTAIESSNNTQLNRAGTPQLIRASQDRPQLPSPAVGIPSSSPPAATNAQFSQIMPLAASPNYSPPVAPRNRAYPQQPTYITPTDSVNPLNPVYSPPQPAQPYSPPEDVCIECTMRDQEMADVDVTSPGVWDRASDAAFEELKRRDLEDEVNGIINNDPNRPRLRGGRLTEQNLRLWLSIVCINLIFHGAPCQLFCVESKGTSCPATNGFQICQVSTSALEGRGSRPCPGYARSQTIG